MLVAEEEETHKTGREERRAVIVAVLVGVWVFVGSSSGGGVLFGVLNAFPEEFISFMYFWFWLLTGGLFDFHDPSSDQTRQKDHCCDYSWGRVGKYEWEDGGTTI